MKIKNIVWDTCQFLIGKVKLYDEKGSYMCASLVSIPHR